MATLYVENIPDDLYEALQAQAKRERKTVAEEVIELLELHVPTEADFEKRHEFLRKIEEFQSREPLSPGPFPSAEEMIREDRER